MNKFFVSALSVFLCLAATVHAETAAERLQQATFKIFNTGSTSTGFLIQDPSPHASRTNVILVSANHTFAKAQGKTIVLVCRTHDATGVWHRLDFTVPIRGGTNNAPLWTSHTTQDVAVLRCTLPPQAAFEALPLAALASEKALETHHISVGSPLFFLGYPHRTEANAIGFPLFRNAVVSGYPLTPASAFPTFFISASTFAGDSGAPVAALTDDGAPIIVGLIVTRTQQNDHLKSDEVDLTFKRDMGLGSAVQAVFIRETIDRLK
jgi:hypothetical protein